MIARAPYISDPPAAATLSRPAPGTMVTSNAMGDSVAAPAPSPSFDFAFRPSLTGGQLFIGHGYISSTQGDGPHAPVIDDVAIGGQVPALLELDPSEVNPPTGTNPFGTSYAVLQVIPDAKGQITAASVAAEHGLEIVHSKDGSASHIATLGRKALTLILWGNGGPVKIVPIVQWNLQYLLSIPSAGNGAPQHFFF
jgi:hypothetical protein